MNYVKKMCILRQVKQGFSGDGKALSGLIKVEQYGRNLAVEISVINFAPLASGEYYCLLSDGKGKTEMLALRGKSMFNILTDMDVSGGFCGVLCHVKNDVIPIAYGINGNRSYDWRAILNATLPPVFPKGNKEKPLPSAKTEIFTPETHEKTKNDAPMYALKQEYDDEKVAIENYYEEENNARKQLSEIGENAYAKSTSEESDEKTGTDVTEDGNAARVLHPFKTDPDGYYYSVKAEIDALFAKYPHDDTLCNAFACSEWVRLKGTAKEPQYLVGVLYDDGRARYVCYALAAQDKNNPPDEIKNVCTFVPSTLFKDTEGFFVIFQSAASGECIKPEQV